MHVIIANVCLNDLETSDRKYIICIRKLVAVANNDIFSCSYQEVIRDIMQSNMLVLSIFISFLVCTVNLTTEVRYTLF